MTLMNVILRLITTNVLINLRSHLADNFLKNLLELSSLLLFEQRKCVTVFFTFFHYLQVLLKYTVAK